MINNGYFVTHYVLLENHIERSLYLNIQHKKRSQSVLLLYCIDSLISENFEMADRV